MELRDYLRMLRANWLIILALTALGALAGLGYSALQPPVYTAEATGYVTTVGQPTVDPGQALVADQLAQSKIASFVAIGSWRTVAESAIEQLALPTTPEALVERVEVTNPLDTTVMVVSASAGSPTEARDLAEAWIRGMIRQIDQLEGTGADGSASVSVVAGDSARLPTSPSSPNTGANVALGAFAGLALAVGVALFRFIVDRRLRDPQTVERESGVPVVGLIPSEKRLSGPRRLLQFGSADDRGTGPAAEAMRELRTNVQFMDVDQPPRAIVITSPVPGDGKSTIAANLALALASAGRTVTLIDSDLRRPSIAGIFGVPGDVGLSDVLARRVTVEQASFRGGRSLTIIPAGRLPPNPSEVLGSNRMRDLIAELSESSLVILDTAPLLPVTDAAVLAARADGALLVASSGKTTFDAVHQSLRNLERTNARVLGMVLNKVPLRGAYRKDSYRYDQRR